MTTLKVVTARDGYDLETYVSHPSQTPLLLLVRAPAASVAVAVAVASADNSALYDPS